MPSDMSEERKEMLKFFGAELVEVDAGDFDGAIELKDKMVNEKGYISLNQFDNPLNVECHEKTTFQEILNDSILQNHGFPQQISAFILGTGTGGTLMGLKAGVNGRGLNSKIIAVEPTESPVMSGGEKGLHGIQGIGDGSKFLVDLDVVDEVITISTEEAKERALTLARENGLFVGISAGANVLASERWIEKNNPNGIVVTILCDRGERYFSLYK
jgi:cysteine synthase A